MSKKIFYWIPKFVGIILGIFFMIAGEFDDSPGLQGIGLILIITIIVFIIRNYSKNKTL